MAVVEWQLSPGTCPLKPQVYQVSSCACNKLWFICLGLSHKPANHSPPLALGKAAWASDSATLGHWQFYFLEAFGSVRLQFDFHSWGKREVLQACPRNTPQSSGEAPPRPPAKMAPVLPIPHMRYGPAAAEMVTDKDRAGEPCVWHVEEAGVQWESMKLQPPLPFPETNLFPSLGFWEGPQFIQLYCFTWIILNWVLAFCLMLLIQQVT